MQITSTQETAPHSVTIARTASGAMTWEVKVYDLHPEDALRTATDIAALLQARYPAPSKEPK